MTKLKRTYLSIGSNLGNKLHHLQKAVNAISKQVGVISRISSVYRTPAWGFEGEDFFNACLAVDTELAPNELLETLLKIEIEGGRKRSEEQGYQARSIDLDILFYEDEVLQDHDLVIPHPRMQERMFVLIPLEEIAPGKLHSTLKQPISELVAKCEDETQPEKIGERLKNPSAKDDFSKFNYIAIEGNIGAGKTSLATKIANDFNGKLILERFADNPFLPKFYEDQPRYAFPLEMSFLADRYQQFTDDTSQLDLFKDFMVSDYDIFKSLIFAQVTLQEEEFKLYRKLFNIMYKDVIKPDLYVYLYQNTERLLQNIKKRGRDYEQSIEAKYLENINHGYFEFIKTQKDMNVMVIDISDMDFVKNSGDYEELVQRILQG